MRAIGFKNFRRFKEMEPLQLGGVNMFVGGNNAGKSTVVKGLLLLLDFLKNSKSSYNETPKFRFDGNESHDVNIDTFKRALCWYTEEKEIAFTASLGNFDLEVCLFSSKDDEKEDVSYADVKYIKIADSCTNITLDFQFTEESGNSGVKIITPKLEYFTEYHKDILSDDLPDVVSYLSDLTNPIYADTPKDKIRQHLLKQYGPQLQELRDRFKKTISRIHLEYIYSHDASQKVLYNKKDGNDYVSKSIHEFYNQRITSKSRVGKDVVCRWLKILCDVDDYRVKSIQGEAYQFELKAGGKWVNLADMGRGFIQIATLVVRIASIIKKYETDNFLRNMSYDREEPIVIVEEPEQNLHPALQSQLAEMFYDVYDRFGIRFIIETHSEYLVRETQIQVARLNCKDESELASRNPFVVYYFPESGNPYNMGYSPKGSFINNFGTGFFDKATLLQFELMKEGKGK